jgi:hypothetical protein
VNVFEPASTWAIIQSQSQSHIATDGQSVSKSWCRAPSGDHDQIFITVERYVFVFCWAPSLTRGCVCLVYKLLALASAVFLGSEILGTRNLICITVSNLRLHFSSPPTTLSCKNGLVLCSRGTQKTQFYCCVSQTIQKTLVT